MNHFDEKGAAIMVDVGAKPATQREATAEGCIVMNAEAFRAIQEGTAKKGDVLGVARVAAIMAAKRTFEIVPLCHPLALTHCGVEFELNEALHRVNLRCTVRVQGPTGVEMEALHGVSAGLLTIYDMCKALDRGMEITDLHLVKKSGGKSGLYSRSEQNEGSI